jgi:hypothetical protein
MTSVSKLCIKPSVQQTVFFGKPFSNFTLVTGVKAESRAKNAASPNSIVHYASFLHRGREATKRLKV